MQPSFFDPENRLAELERMGDPLVRLDLIVDWSTFKPVLKKIHQKPRKSHAGRKPWDPVRMFKMRVLQTLYNLSDDQTEFQVRDRLSFQRFLGLAPKDRVPDTKSHYGYKNHINIDKKNKLIRRYAVTDAAIHDSQVFDELLDEENRGRSKVRARVEHVFGHQHMLSGGGFWVRVKGKVRDAAKISLMNLVYNMRRLEYLLRDSSAQMAV